MTRSQNLSLVSACRAPLWECEETHSERAPEGQWLDAQPHPIFAPDGDSFLLLAAVQEGDKEHFTHIKHVTLTQQRIAVLSHGRYEVSNIRSMIDRLIMKHQTYIEIVMQFSIFQQIAKILFLMILSLIHVGTTKVPLCVES